MLEVKATPTTQIVQPVISGESPDSRKTPQQLSPDERRGRADAAVAADVAAWPWGLRQSEGHADALSIAWERSARSGLQWTIAKWHARRELRCYGMSRTFTESARSTNNDQRRNNPRLNPGPRRTGREVEWMANTTDPRPDVLAADRLDLEEWCDHLSHRQKRILSLLQEGYDVEEIAVRVETSGATVYAEVNRMRRSWVHFSSLTGESNPELGDRGRPRAQNVLTQREVMVLKLVVEGLNETEICQRIGATRAVVSYVKVTAQRKVKAFTPEAIAQAVAGAAP
jgi:DNA-binding NarL/FixJ family response regulator